MALVFHIFFFQGQVLKIVNTNDKTESSKTSQQPILVEELQVLKYGEPILNLMISKGTEKSPRSLLVTTSDEIMSVPLQRCHVATTCSACVALQVWFGNLTDIMEFRGMEMMRATLTLVLLTPSKSNQSSFSLCLYNMLIITQDLKIQIPIKVVLIHLFASLIS